MNVTNTFSGRQGRTAGRSVCHPDSFKARLRKDRSRADRNTNQRCGNYNNVMEPEYDVVDDQEEVLNVRIFPARPMNEDREYADRDLPRLLVAERLTSPSTNNPKIPPRKPPGIPVGPAIDRDLKPGRRKTRLDKRATPVHPGEQRAYRHSLSPQPLTLELLFPLPGLTVHESSMRDGQRTVTAKFSPPTIGFQGSEGVSALHNNLRHSLDLETHDIEKRLQQSLDRVSSKHHHHEWPQNKEDQHDFVPMEKPPKTYFEDDWYVGACSRADAEHALHLVNKDGAFLVRDCSVNTNSEPLVLAVYHDKKVYNVKIRFMESVSKYALGTRQRLDDMFDSVADIVKFHSIFPITLFSGRNMPGSRYPESCVLCYPVTKRDVGQLLQ